MPSLSPPIIGLTGGIGSGKSTVASMLADLGCVVADSDAAGRLALDDPEIRAQLVAWWGDGILGDDGRVARAAVAAIVFAEPAERKRLEALTHPWIEARRVEQFAAAAPETRAFVIDAPLLMEAGLDAACDAVIYVDACESKRRRRVESGRGWDRSELGKREDSQLPLDAKRSRADHVLTNDGDLSELRSQVHEVFRRIVESLNGTRRNGCTDD